MNQLDHQPLVVPGKLKSFWDMTAARIDHKTSLKINKNRPNYATSFKQ